MRCAIVVAASRSSDCLCTLYATTAWHAVDRHRVALPLRVHLGGRLSLGRAGSPGILFALGPTCTLVLRLALHARMVLSATFSSDKQPAKMPWHPSDSSEAVVRW